MKTISLNFKFDVGLHPNASRTNKNMKWWSSHPGKMKIVKNPFKCKYYLAASDKSYEFQNIKTREISRMSLNLKRNRWSTRFYRGIPRIFCVVLIRNQRDYVSYQGSLEVVTCWVLLRIYKEAVVNYEAALSYLSLILDDQKRAFMT